MHPGSCVRACIHACIHTHIHTHDTDIHIYRPEYMHTCIHASIHPFIHPSIHPCIHTYVHTYRHINHITYYISYYKMRSILYTIHKTHTYYTHPRIRTSAPPRQVPKPSTRLLSLLGQDFVVVDKPPLLPCHAHVLPAGLSM